MIGPKKCRDVHSLGENTIRTIATPTVVHSGNIIHKSTSFDFEGLTLRHSGLELYTYSMCATSTVWHGTKALCDLSCRYPPGICSPYSYLFGEETTAVLRNIPNFAIFSSSILPALFIFFLAHTHAHARTES